MELNQSLGLVFFALALLYFLTVCFAIIRVVKLHRFSKDWRTSKVFYLSLAVLALLRTIFIVIIFTKDSATSNQTMFCLLSLPDCLFIISYMILFWQYISIFYYAHAENKRSTLLAKLSKRPMQSIPSMMVLLGILGWTLTETTLYILLILDILDPIMIGLEVAYFEAILPTVVFSLMIILQIKFSGSPLRGREWKKKLNRIAAVVAVWTVSSYFRASVGLFDNYSSKPVSEDLTDQDPDISFVRALMLITYFIVSEIFCYFLTLDYSFMGIFVFSEQESSELNTPLTNEQISFERTRRFSYLPENTQLTEKQIELKDEFETKKNGLGTLIRGTYMGRQIIYRKIEFSRLSGYVLEELTNEVSELRQVDFEGVLPIVGVCIELPVLGIVLPWMSAGSLYKALHIDHRKIEMSKKRQMALSIAKCMALQHNAQQFHGHLSSWNILLDDDLNTFVADNGLKKLKKYAGIMLNYSNKSAWSSPEQLKERSSATVKVVQSDDVYSFGVIFWELMTEQVPFPGFSRQKLFQKVAVENYRPQIPEDMPRIASDMLKSCWNTDPNMRPDFKLIIQNLERYLMP